MSAQVTATSRSGNVPSIQREMAELFRVAIDAAFPDVGVQPVVHPTPNPKYGDYQCNNAMALHGKLKGTEGAPKAPRDVANKIVAALPASPAIAKMELAGPGFINVTLADGFVADRLLAMLRRWAGAGRASHSGQGLRVISAQLPPRPAAGGQAPTGLSCPSAAGRRAQTLPPPRPAAWSSMCTPAQPPPQTACPYRPARVQW